MFKMALHNIHSPSAHRSQCISVSCYGTSRAQDRAQNQNGHTQWSMAVGQSILPPKGKLRMYV